MTTVAEPTHNGTSKTQSVYVIGHDGSGVVKIGKADDVEDRLAGIQRMSPVKLRVLTRFDGGYKLETALHRRFKHLRTHGEWFDFGDEDPAAAVSEAVTEIQAEWVVAAERQASEPKPSGRTAEVFLIKGRLWVMPAQEDGGWQCVGRNSSRRRCMSYPGIHGSATGPTWTEWIIPGIGRVTGICVDSNERFTDIIASCQDQAMRQLCDKHFKAPGCDVIAEPAWQPFDPVKHESLITRFEPYELGDWIAIAPGFDDVHAKVEAYAARLLATRAARAARKGKRS